jgi:hypothetical protein
MPVTCNANEASFALLPPDGLAKRQEFRIYFKQKQSGGDGRVNSETERDGKYVSGFIQKL